ncbi:protein translocase subunit SecF, partial [Streptomyces sp. NPDC051940]|uniref:protein translocase subunit SecF n=1 Tax=Streptomyces sp. NPDC051940 TaxID=3155675 RepID=UPI0034151BF1
MSRLGTLGARLYRGEVGYDFVGKRFLWYGISILITIVAIAGFMVRGLNMGIEFEGGAVFTTPKGTTVSVEHAQEAAEKASGHQAIVQELGGNKLRIQVAGIETAQSDKVREALADDFGIKDAGQIDAQLVGPSWGEEIASKAWQGLWIFMVLVVIYLAIAFEWRMAVAALIALIHDLTITVGVYALVGFEVTPGTVIGLLTILGYSLYDTVVVFDGLKESSKDFTKQTQFTYRELANRSLTAELQHQADHDVTELVGERRPEGAVAGEQVPV